MNKADQVSVCGVGYQSFGHVPKMGMPESYGMFVFSFLEFPTLGSRVAAQVYTLTNGE